jgi:hypothetical protein
MANTELSLPPWVKCARTFRFEEFEKGGLGTTDTISNAS